MLLKLILSWVPAKQSILEAMEHLFARYLETRPLFFAPARPINEEWKIRPYFGVFPFFFKALEKERDDTVLKIFSSGLTSPFTATAMVPNFQKKVVKLEFSLHLKVMTTSTIEHV